MISTSHLPLQYAKLCFDSDVGVRKMQTQPRSPARQRLHGIPVYRQLNSVVRSNFLRLVGTDLVCLKVNHARIVSTRTVPAPGPIEIDGSLLPFTSRRQVEETKLPGVFSVDVPVPVFTRYNPCDFVFKSISLRCTREKRLLDTGRSVDARNGLIEDTG